MNKKDDKPPKMQVDYQELMDIWTHLSREHALPQTCEGMKALAILWGRGCNEVCAWREKRQ
jgi:hypothetical protein